MNRYSWSQLLALKAFMPRWVRPHVKRIAAYTVHHSCLQGMDHWWVKPYFIVWYETMKKRVGLQHTQMVSTLIMDLYLCMSSNAM